MQNRKLLLCTNRKLSHCCNNWNEDRPIPMWQICAKLCLILLKLRDYKLKDKIKKKPENKGKSLVRPTGLEPATFWFVVRRSISSPFLIIIDYAGGFDKSNAYVKRRIINKHLTTNGFDESNAYRKKETISIIFKLLIRLLLKAITWIEYIRG